MTQEHGTETKTSKKPMTYGPVLGLMSPSLDASSVDAMRDPQKLTAYLFSVYDRIDNDVTKLSRASLWRPSSGKMFDRNCRLTFSMVRDYMVAGCYVEAGEDGRFEVKGLFKYPCVSSNLVFLIVAHSIADIARLNGDAVEFTTSYRLYPPGWRDGLGRSHAGNEASRAIFARLGFVNAPGEPVTYEWTGHHHDHHLSDSLEADGRTYRNQPMVSTPDTLRLAREFLFRTRWGRVN